jgi:6-phosphogluconolactonase
VIEHRFADGDALAAALAAAVADDLRAGIAAHGAALLAVSGGTTPGRFLSRLSAEPLVWDRVTVTLADERWVPVEHARSNEAVVRHALLRHEAAEARFVPLYVHADTPEAALPMLQASFDALPYPFDAIVLGMGTDGHCASLFPDGDRLAEALDPNGTARVLPMRAPGAGEPRTTLTLASLRATRQHNLHLEGAEKRAVLDRALAAPDAPARYPIRAVFDHVRVPLHVFWSR